MRVKGKALGQEVYEIMANRKEKEQIQFNAQQVASAGVLIVCVAGPNRVSSQNVRGDAGD